MSGKVKAFQHFGVTLKNEQWSWSGRNETGEVVLSLWTDEMNYKLKPPTYSIFNLKSLPDWKDKPGNKERINNLVWAKKNSGGIFNVVMCKAKIPITEPKIIDEAYPTKLIMRLIDLNEITGEFTAELVENI